MNVVEMHQWFDQIQDKVDSIYYTEPEKDLFINRSIQTFIDNIVNNYIADRRTGEFIISSTLEESLNVSEVLKPLTLLRLSVASNSSGIITDTAIDDAILAETDEDATFLHILSLTDADGAPVSYVRENDFAVFQRNDFKEATLEYAQYSIGYGGLFITPV